MFWVLSGGVALLRDKCIFKSKGQGMLIYPRGMALNREISSVTNDRSSSKARSPSIVPRSFKVNL